MFHFVDGSPVQNRHADIRDPLTSLPSDSRRLGRGLLLVLVLIVTVTCQGPQRSGGPWIDSVGSAVTKKPSGQRSESAFGAVIPFSSAPQSPRRGGSRVDGALRTTVAIATAPVPLAMDFKPTQVAQDVTPASSKGIASAAVGRRTTSLLASSARGHAAGNMTLLPTSSMWTPTNGELHAPLLLQQSENGSKSYSAIPERAQEQPVLQQSKVADAYAGLAATVVSVTSWAANVDAAWRVVTAAAAAGNSSAQQHSLQPEDLTELHGSAVPSLLNMSSNETADGFFDEVCPGFARAVLIPSDCSNLTQCEEEVRHKMIAIKRKQAESGFGSLIQQYDCRHAFRYSEAVDCKKCVSSYDLWLCAMELTVYWNSSSSDIVGPCAEVCDAVVKDCPYVHPEPTSSAPAVEPCFVCRDKHIEDNQTKMKQCYSFIETRDLTGTQSSRLHMVVRQAAAAGAAASASTNTTVLTWLACWCLLVSCWQHILAGANLLA